MILKISLQGIMAMIINFRTSSAPVFILPCLLKESHVALLSYGTLLQAAENGEARELMHLP